MKSNNNVINKSYSKRNYDKLFIKNQNKAITPSLQITKQRSPIHQELKYSDRHIIQITNQRSPIY